METYECSVVLKGFFSFEDEELELVNMFSHHLYRGEFGDRTDEDWAKDSIGEYQEDFINYLEIRKKIPTCYRGVHFSAAIHISGFDDGNEYDEDIDVKLIEFRPMTKFELDGITIKVSKVKANHEHPI